MKDMATWTDRDSTLVCQFISADRAFRYDCHQSENSFMSSEMIVALRKFLLKSFAEEYQIAGSVDVGSV